MTGRVRRKKKANGKEKQPSKMEERVEEETCVVLKGNEDYALASGPMSQRRSFGRSTVGKPGVPNLKDGRHGRKVHLCRRTSTRGLSFMLMFIQSCRISPRS